MIGQLHGLRNTEYAANLTVFTQGSENDRDRLPAGRKALQRAAATADFTEDAEIKKLSHLPREILQISQSAFDITSDFSS